MASSWIKVEVITPDKPEIFQIAEILNIDPDAVLGKLVRIWAWADQQTIDGIRTQMFPIGSYHLANSPRGSVDTCFRKFSMTVRQLVMEFGLDKVSTSVKGMWETRRRWQIS